MHRILFAASVSFGVAVSAASAQAPLDAKTAVYELRTYYPARGKSQALNARFRDHTTKLFTKHGMVNVAYWNETPTPENPDGRLVYVLAFPSKAAAEADWKAFVADPAWKKVEAESQVDGKLIDRIDSVYMTAADYSPAINLEGR